jgi:hypothetical protein
MITSSNIPSETQPRLVCRLVRRWCALSNGHRPAHVASCADCRIYFAATDQLESQLRHDTRTARRSVSSPSPWLEDRILHAVRDAEPEQRTASGRRGRILIMSGLSAAVAAIAVLLSLRVESGSRLRDAGASPTPAEDAAVIMQSVESLSAAFVTTVLPTAGELVAENPLQQELGSVYSDMRSALDFLALNFLPTARVETTPQRQRQI